jgi:hypothetical protein
MGIETALAITAAATLVGTGVQVAGMAKQEAAQEKAEKAREQQMNLDMQRKRRETMRQAVLARSTALTNANAQGAQQGSGLQGGLAQITGAEYRNVGGLRQDQALGKEVFEANRDYAFGQMITGFGSAMTNSASAMGRLGAKIS